MSSESALPERIASIPKVEEDIALSVALPLADGGIGQWSLLGDDQSALVRQSLLEAERMRLAHTDPGDAFLLGAGFAYRSVAGQIQTEQLRRDLDENDSLIETEFTETKVHTRKGLRRVLGITTLLAVFSHHKTS